MKNKNKGTVGLLGMGEIGKVIARLCSEVGYKVLVRELEYDEIKGNKIDYFHINIHEDTPSSFVKLVTKNVKELSPKLTIINSSTTPGVTERIYLKTKLPIVHSPIIGLHPQLYESIKNHFPKIIGPVNNESLKLAKKHLEQLGLHVEEFKSSRDTEAAKLFDLTYYTYNIIFCKWVNDACKDLNLNFEDVYTRYNHIYNDGYSNLLPNVVRPVLVPHKGPITGQCAIPDIEMVHKLYPNPITKLIMNQNRKYYNETSNLKKSRKEFIKLREKMTKHETT